MQFILFLYDFVKTTVYIVSEIVTLGGVGRLKDAKTKYQDLYKTYEKKRYKLNEVYSENKTLLEDIGRRTKKAFVNLEKSLAAMRQHGFEAENDYYQLGQSAIQTNIIHRADKLNTWYSSAAHATVGAASGSALAVGSWTMVATIGTASTGTAIGTLSGAAAFNATMAWFGGGAIAAGGAGIAGGLMVISGIVLFPLIILWGYTIHKKAKKLEDGCEQLELELSAFSQKAVQGKEENKLIKANHSKICGICDNFIDASEHLYNKLYPHGFFSRLKQSFLYIFNIGVFPKRQQEIDDFSTEMSKFLELFGETQVEHQAI
ncbi:MAG: hypothetical protein ACJA2G_003063 [Cognaticolwellia sp.]|jgi:hypothetical protein